MGNPKKGTLMEHHTKQKVLIYDAYLKLYLRIILQSHYQKISIFDSFAGIGKYENGDGSALVACKNINSRRIFHPDKEIYLYLNEQNSRNREILRNECNFDFVKEISNLDAKEFILKHSTTEINGHKLWFIDPYGYTQIYENHLSQIMHNRNTEIIIFIPVSFIYRFLNGNLKDERLQSIANFLNSYSIDQNEAQRCSTPPQFANLIAKTFQNKHGYSWHATMQEGGNYYTLFYIGQNPYGLEKFLEARDSILEDTPNFQFSLVPVGEEKDLLKAVQLQSPIDNCNLYILGLNNGFRPPIARTLLEELEKKGNIIVKVLSGKTRRKGIFFNRFEYVKNKDKRIQIIAPDQQGELPL